MSAREHTHTRAVLGVAVLLAAMASLPVSADVLVTRSGRRYEGKVSVQGAIYEIKLANGGSMTLPRSMVKELIRGPVDLPDENDSEPATDPSRHSRIPVPAPGVVPAARPAAKAGTPTADAAASYVLVDLGPIPIGRPGFPRITDGGRVLLFGPDKKPAIWKDGTRTPIRTRPVALSVSDINDRGQVCGGGRGGVISARHKGATYRSPTFCAYAGPAGSVRALASPQNTSVATAINDRGQVAGYVMQRRDPRKPGASGWRPVVWSGSRQVDLGSLGGARSAAQAIADNGFAAGFSENPARQRRAFVWDTRRMRDVTPPGVASAEAVALNAAGQAVGKTGPPKGPTKAFLWDGSRSIVLEAPGSTGGKAADINDAGVIVGSADYPRKVGRATQHLPYATIWARGRAIRLEQRIEGGVKDWLLEHATGISRAGVIVGIGRRGGHERYHLRPLHYFLARPAGAAPPVRPAPSPKPAVPDALAEMLYPIRVGDKYGYIDATGKVVVQPQYARAWDFHDGRGRVFVGTIGRGRLGNAIFSGQYGYLDATGKMVIPARYATAGDFSGGLAPVKGGYIDVGGRLVIAYANLGPTVLGGPLGIEGLALDPLGPETFSEGLAAVRYRPPGSGRHVHQKAGFIDSKGKLTVRTMSPHALPFREGLAAVGHGERWSFIDRTGKVVTTILYKEVGPFGSGLAPVRVGADRGFKCWGYVDKTGRLALPIRYTAARSFHEGLAWVQADVNANRWICIDPDARELFALPGVARQMVGDFHEGLARVNDMGVSFFVNSLGKKVTGDLPGQARDFHGGLARIVQIIRQPRRPPTGEHWAYIDKLGRYVWASNRKAFGLQDDYRSKLAAHWEVWVQPQDGTVVEIYPDDDLTKYRSDAEFLRGKTPLDRHVAEVGHGPGDGMTAIVRFAKPKPPFILRISHKGCRTLLRRITSTDKPFKWTMRGDGSSTGN